MSAAPSYRWKLADGYPASNGLKVFSTFACGGGSSMGYKLAGYDVLGCLDVDRDVFDVYVYNHHPRLAYNEDIRTFRTRTDLPPELFELDILDGSPPCSSFSVSGNRHKDWGKKKKFREGQAKQRLDDLFFEFIELGKRLRPKVIIAENVKGMLVGAAKGFVPEIVREFENAGYAVQLFLLNAASMGVPQRRERVFFLCRRLDLDLPQITMQFDDPPITYREIMTPGPARRLSDAMIRKWWNNRVSSDRDFSDITKRLGDQTKLFNRVFVDFDKPLNTLVSAEGAWHVRRDIPEEISIPEMILGASFPFDYKFRGLSPKYLTGMSVPPVMMARVAMEVKRQWFDRLVDLG